MIHFRQSDRHDGAWSNLAPDLTPILDILFILIVFFMLTTGTVFQSLELKLPSAVDKELSEVNESASIMIEIVKDSYVMNGKKIRDMEQLKQQITTAVQSKPEHELMIAGDRNIPIERLLKVLTYLQSQGIEAANILMQNENEP